MEAQRTGLLHRPHLAIRWAQSRRAHGRRSIQQFSERSFQEGIFRKDRSARVCRKLHRALALSTRTGGWQHAARRAALAPLRAHAIDELEHVQHLARALAWACGRAARQQRATSGRRHGREPRVGEQAEQQQHRALVASASTSGVRVLQRPLSSCCSASHGLGTPKRVAVPRRGRRLVGEGAR